MRVHCEMCDSMVPVEEVHSCFDAALLKQQQEAKKEAERAVIDAAVEWHSVEFRAYHMQVMQNADEKLYAAVAALRELEGEV